MDQAMGPCLAYPNRCLPVTPRRECTVTDVTIRFHVSPSRISKIQQSAAGLHHTPHGEQSHWQSKILLELDQNMLPGTID
jgi:hypothetical protein